MKTFFKLFVAAALIASLASSDVQAGSKLMNKFCGLLFESEDPKTVVLPASTEVPPWPAPVEAKPGQRKVVILSSGVGMGHNSTARAIEKAVLEKDPGALIRTIEIEMLQHPTLTKAELKVFWTVVKRFPWLYDIFYERHMKKTDKHGLKAVRQNVDQSFLEDFIASEKPDVVIAVHQMTAAGLALMRRKGLLENTRVGFVATDYFVDFLTDVAKELDYTLVPHPELIPRFLEKGVPKEKIGSVGMPVNPEAFKPIVRAEFLKENGLSPDLTTITLASGGEGVGDYPKIVKSLARSYTSRGMKVQIVAICGKNEAHVKNLNKLVEKLKAEGATLVVKGFTKQPEMFGFIKSSDLYITKSGGLSPSEGFAMNRPMILLDVYGGHERVNAQFFEKIGVALITRNQGNIGEMAYELLTDPELIAKMLAEQRKVSRLQDFSKISDFAVPEPK